MRGEWHRLQSRVDILGHRICGVVARLEDLGFRFERPGEVFPGPIRMR
jgi:hypothetical protein